MEYPEVARRLSKKIDISYYLNSVVGLCAYFINYDERYHPSTETILEALKKLKDGKKAGDNKADDDGMNEDDLNEDEEDEDEMDEDEVSKIRDVLAQKSAEKWVREYIKDLHTGPKKNHAIIAHLWKEASTYVKKIFDTYYADKQEESIRLRLSSLLKEFSKIDVGYKKEMYKLVIKNAKGGNKRKSKAMAIEQYLLYYSNECKLLADLRNTWYKVVGLEITCYWTLSRLQDDKKDDLPKVDIDEIIKLYG
ncbi:unnamed protein product [Rhizophagus irregularis]|nr:unnamed protein product [Rhizophagus irregularis]